MSSSSSSEPSQPSADGRRLRIAAEEAYAPRAVIDEYRRLLDTQGGDAGFRSLWSYYLLNQTAHTGLFRSRITDLGDRRLSDMADLGIDHQVLSLATPGVELFELPLARELAAMTNECIAEACRRHPSKFSGLAAVALQDVEFSVKELRRAVRDLGLKGVIANSHTRGEYLDAPKFEVFWATVAELDVPVYLHPNTPSDGLIGPLLDSGLDGAIFGFGVETGMHLIRIIFSGVFDRYPSLRLVVGHLGEALPFWAFRVDHFHHVQDKTGRYPWRPSLKQPPSHYLKTNIWLTTSGMAWEPAIMFARQVVGADRVMYAMDYPFQVSSSEVEVHESLPIGEDEKETLLDTAARRVFGLGPEPSPWSQPREGE
ncbi:amidohydrolase family protein [Streptomyces spongiae]|uniref:Amidohydrolase n=1 Tax=Streptomyces spongiae TaxID=565072 RepID=A0A5N8XJ87_9ACTN|nr:amidohydrolase family protein [Streptomyces spongiae]MPY59530.1 amidohydrolase [Streptomyces spongiae]